MEWFLEAIFLIPNMDAVKSTALYPINTVIWSLLFEVIINLIYAIFAKRINIYICCFFIIISLMAMALIGNLGGNTVENFSDGIWRVLAGFGGGVLIHLLYRMGKLPVWRGSFIPCAIILIIIFLLPIKLSGIYLIPVYVVLSGTIILVASAKLNHVISPVVFLSGEISYSLYLLHRPTFRFLEIMANKFNFLSHHALALGLVSAGPIVMFSYICSKYIDDPIRLQLTRLILPNKLD